MSTGTMETKGSSSALDVIHARRSIRSYTGKPIEKDVVRSLLEAAVQAPTALHEEPWAFVVIQDSATLKRISERAKALWAGDSTHERQLHSVGEQSLRTEFARLLADPDFSLFYDAGTLIVICGKSVGPFVVADCWLAAENLMLAACAKGLGTCCIGSAVGALNSEEIKRELGIPQDVVAVAPIIVGEPRSSTRPTSPRKPPEVLVWKT
jgi:nitroreductase